MCIRDRSREDYSSTGGGKRRREKGLFGRFKDWIMGNNDSEEGTGGSLYGRGGSTTYNRMSVNGTGGYGTGGWPFGGKKDGKTIIDKMKYDPNHPMELINLIHIHLVLLFTIYLKDIDNMIKWVC